MSTQFNADEPGDSVQHGEETDLGSQILGIMRIVIRVSGLEEDAADNFLVPTLRDNSCADIAGWIS